MMMQLVFAEWALITQRIQRHAAQTETERLRERLGKQKDSIWTMTKDELVEVAHRELQMSYQKAQKETVVTLRERIRQARAKLGPQPEADPMLRIPKGLERMALADLSQECARREISSPMTDKRGPTRASLIVLIRDDVEERNAGPKEQTRQRSSSLKRTATQIGGPSGPEQRSVL